MQWNGPIDGNWANDDSGEFLFGPIDPPSSAAMRQVRMEWIQSLIENGEYEGCDLLNQALDEMLVEKFFSE